MKITINRLCLFSAFLFPAIVIYAHPLKSKIQLQFITSGNYNQSELCADDTTSKTKVELYNAGMNAFKNSDYQQSLEYFRTYKQNFPNEIYGYYWCMRNAINIDTGMHKGLAIDDALKFISLAEKDREKMKAMLIFVYQYLEEYYSKINVDREKSKYYHKKLKQIDPGNKDAEQKVEGMLS